MFSWNMTNHPQAGHTQDLTIKFTVTAYATETNIAADEVKPGSKKGHKFDVYTSPERFIESTNPKIAATARRLADGETNPLMLARIFYDYVIDTSTYNLTGTGLHGARELLGTHRGECGDYAALFTALSRASGIPARPIVGYWAISGVEQTHVWAEFYLRGVGWIPVDPTVGQSEPQMRDYYFGNMDNQRIILHKGFNVALDPAAPDDYIAPLLQVPQWWYWGSGDPSTITIDRTAWKVD